MEVQSRRVRKPNWTREEVCVLLKELLVEKEILFGTSNQINPTKTKAAIWKKITDKICACCGVAKRTPMEVKLKWKGLKKDIIDKDRSKAKDKFIPFEDVIRNVIGKTSTSSLASDSEASGGDWSISHGETSAYQEALVLVKTESCAEVQVQFPEQQHPSVSISPTSVNSNECSPSDTVEDPSHAGAPVERELPVSDFPAAPPRLAAMMNGLVRRRRPAGRPAARAVPGRAAGEEETDSLFAEYLKTEIEKNKTEIEKNNLKIELLRSQVEEMQERKRRRIEESNSLH